jgi:two-component system, response regulator YesN
MEELQDRAESFKVLIVEDSALFRQLLKETLNNRFSSIQVYEAINGQEALQKTEALSPDLIFMDLKLPGQDDPDLTKKIRARVPNGIVIPLTTYDLQQYADFFFSKNPSATENIFALVKAILSEGE